MAESRKSNFWATDSLSNMKFLGDMGISPRTIQLLREQGYDATHLIEQNLERMADPNILEKAQQEGQGASSSQSAARRSMKQYNQSISLYSL